MVTDIPQDLATFDSLFRLPPAHISVVTALARATAAAAMLAALPIAIRDTDVVSFSGALGEHFFSPAQVAGMRRILREAAARHVTVVAASGDSGAVSDTYRFGTAPVKEVSLPASSPFVLGVGGTTLTVGPQTGAYIGETAWNQLVQGGGTSAATPLWGGLIADADQMAGHDLGFVNPALYQIARTSLYRQAFHDVTTGDNTVVISGTMYTGYQAGPGWDPVTGLGSPDAAVLIPILSHRSMT